MSVYQKTVLKSQKFQNKYNFPFELLSDENIKVIKMLKAWGEKNYMEKSLWVLKELLY